MSTMIARTRGANTRAERIAKPDPRSTGFWEGGQVPAGPLAKDMRHAVHHRALGARAHEAV